MKDRPMPAVEDGDSDAAAPGGRWRSQADYRADFSDDVDPIADAKARPQQGSDPPTGFPGLGGTSRFPIPDWPGIGKH